MITTLLHLLLFPFLCGGHRQLALENLALRQQLAVYKRTANRPKLRSSEPALLGLPVQGVGRVEAAPRDRYPRHRAALAAAPLPSALDQALRPAHWGPPPRSAPRSEPLSHAWPPRIPCGALPEPMANS